MPTLSEKPGAPAGGRSCPCAAVVVDRGLGGREELVDGPVPCEGRRALRRGRPEPISPPGLAGEGDPLIDERVVAIHEHPRRIVLDRVAHPRHVVRKCRCTADGGFEYREPPSLMVGRVNQQPCLTKQLRLTGLVHPTLHHDTSEVGLSAQALSETLSGEARARWDAAKPS